MALSIFNQSVLAMMGQSHELSTISQNIANINTTAYKRTDTSFKTVLSSTTHSFTANTTSGAGISGNQTSDLGGVLPVDTVRVGQAGQVQPSSSNLDAAINGDGFFMVSPDINVNSNIQYTRNGSFKISVSDLTDTVTLDNGTTGTINEGYLTDQNGNYVLGVPVNADGTFTLGTPAPMRLDNYAFATTGVTTTQATLNGNLPANDAGGTVETSSLKVVDSNFDSQNLRLDFTKAFGTDNTWDFRLLGDNISSITASPGATYSPVTTATYDMANPTAATDVVQFSTNSGGGTISVFNDLDPGNGTQVGAPKAGTFAGLKPGDTITITGAGGNDNTYTIKSVSDNQASITVDSSTPVASNLTTGDAVTFSSDASIPQQLTFDNKGALSSASTYNFDVTFTGGSTASFSLDVSQLQQFAGDFDPGSYTQNGAAKSNLQNLTIGSGGEIYGSFTDGTQRALYKMPLTTFSNPNALELKSGQNFVETQQSGTPNTQFADVSGSATIQGNALEASNVDIGTEMTRLIAAQSAYNFAATAFKTADDILKTAGQLKT